MAVLVALGGALAGPALGVGANVGWIIGAVIGTLLFPPPKQVIEGPRLGDLTVTASTYGQAIPIAYGTMRMGGNMIWSTGIEEVKRVEKGGKGMGSGPDQVTYEYYCTFAIAFCEGEVEDVLRMWADGKLIYDKTGSGDEITKVNLQYRLYPGDETQEPDSLIENDKGVGSTPAYRGTCYIVFNRLPLKDFGNRVPNITAELAFAARDQLPSVDMDFFSVGEGGLASTMSSNFFPDIVREVVWGMQESGTVGQNIARRFGVRGMVEDRQRAYTQDASANDIHFMRLMAVTPEGYALAYSESSNRRPIHIINPDTLEIDDTFGSATMGTTHTYTNFAAPAPGKSCFAVVMGLLGVQYLLIVPSNFNSVGVLDVTGGTIEYVWSTDTAANMPDPDPNTYSRVVGTCPGAVGLDYGEAYFIMGPSYGVSPTSSEFTLYKLTIEDGAKYEIKIDNIHWGCVAETVATYTPSDFSSAEGAGAFVGDQFLVLAGPIYDETDDTVMVQFHGYHSVMGEVGYFMAKIDPSSGAVLWVTETPSIRNELTGFNHSRVRYGTYGEMTSTTGWLLRTWDGKIIKTITGFATGHTTSGASFWVDALTAVIGYSSAGITKWFLDRGEGGVADLQNIVEDLCARAGYDTADYDASDLAGIEVPGYLLGRQTPVRDAIQPLANLFFFDGVESDHQIKFELRDGKASQATITQDNLAPIGGESKSEDFFRESRVQEVELPMSFSLTYMDPDNDYQQAVHSAKRIVKPTATMNSGEQAGVQIPVACSAATAKQAAEKALYAAWIERSSYQFKLPWTYLALDPADIVTVTLDDGSTFRSRIAQFDVGLDLSIDVTGISEEAAQYTSTVSAAKGESGLTNVFLGSSLTKAIVLCSPLLRDRDDTGRTISIMYVFMGGYGQSGWRAGSLYKADDGIDYNPVGVVTSEMTWGSASNALGDVDSPWVNDETNTLTVYLNTGELSSCTQLQMVNGANAAALIPTDGSNPEIIQFRDVVENADGSYTLSGLLRGRRGTELNTGLHSAGDTFVLLEVSSGMKVQLAIDEKDASRYYRGVTTDTLFEEAPVVIKASPLNDLKPYAVVHHAASIDGSNNITITWVRRTRVGGGLADGVGDVALGEDDEEYEIEIFDGPAGSEVREVTGLSSATYTYSAADQTTDGFSPPLSAITVKVYQISAQVGRGFSTEVTINVE